MTLLIYILLVYIAKALIPGLDTIPLYIIGVIVWLLHLCVK